MERVPDLPFGLIFQELSWEDRLSLRRTCKKLKLLVDGQVSRNLFLFLRSYPCHENLFHTNEAIYYADSCRVLNFDRFISNYKGNLKRLRRLTIYFKGLYWIVDYHEKIYVNLDSLRDEMFFKETWKLEIDLEHLNLFEHVEHLEIKVNLFCEFFSRTNFHRLFSTQGAGKVFGELRLKNLRILSIETHRLSEFDLDCPALEAMCIAFGARPNFINNPHPLDYLSVKRPLSEGPREYLCKLYGQCPNLSTIGFDCVLFIATTLFEVNVGRVSLPLWRVVKFEGSWKYFPKLEEELLDCFVEYEKRIKPERLRIIYNDELITQKQLVSIVEFHKQFFAARDESRHAYLNALERNNALNCLFSDKIRLDLDENIQLDLALKLKHLEELIIFSGSPRIDEKLFRWMLTTWSKLNRLWIHHPHGTIGQHQLEQMPGHWPNLCSLRFNEKPEDIKFVAEFKNLKELEIKFNLSKEETQHLMRNCPSLYFINFENTSTDLNTALMARMGWLHETPLIQQRLISEEETGGRLITFDSIERAIDHLYDHDLFNAPRLLNDV